MFYSYTKKSLSYFYPHILKNSAQNSFFYYDDCQTDSWFVVKLIGTKNQATKNIKLKIIFMIVIDLPRQIFVKSVNLALVWISFFPSK